ncbi:MAG: hypothetical protein WDM92_06405 [Caulobacteraceae bacterium]
MATPTTKSFKSFIVEIGDGASPEVFTAPLRLRHQVADHERGVEHGHRARLRRSGGRRLAGLRRRHPVGADPGLRRHGHGERHALGRLVRQRPAAEYPHPHPGRRLSRRPGDPHQPRRHRRPEVQRQPRPAVRDAAERRPVALDAGSPG